MRYFIFKDSEIVGPYEPQELGGAGGLSADILVCAESASGRYDNDWIPASDVAELAGARVSALAATAVLDEPLAGEAGAFERLELDTAGLPGVSGEGESWLLDLMDDVEFRQRWGELLPKPSEDAEELAQAKISDLTGQLEALRSRLSELEIYRSARPAPAPVPAFEAPPPARIAPAIAAPPAPQPAEIKPEIPADLPPIKLGAAPAPASGPASAPAPAPAPAPEGAQTEFEKHGSTFTFKGKGKAQPQSGAHPIKFSQSQAFRIVEREPHPASLPAAGPPEAFSAQGPGAVGTPSVYEWNAPAQPPSSLGLPAAGSAPPPAPGPSSVPSLPAAPAAPAMPTPLPAFEMPSALPPAPAPLTSPPAPMTMTTPAPLTITPPTPVFTTPAPAIPPPTLSPGLGVPAPVTAPPITAPPLTVSPQAPYAPPVTASPQAPYAPPVTMMFGAPAAAPTMGAGPFSSGGMPPLEPPPVPQMPGFGAAGPVGFGGAVNPMGAMTPSRANAGAVTPTPATDDVVARLAKPAPPATDKKPARRKSPVMLIVGVVGLVALFGLIFLFLYHDRRGLKSMVTMGGDQKPIGSVVEDEPKAPPGLPKQAAPASTVSPAPTTAAPGGTDKIPDAGEAAVALVKNYPLAGDRGTVGQWLTYSYNADGGSKEEWNAGAVDADSYAVEYKVQPGANSQRKEAISYLFEADTSRRIVQGKNQAARALLTGGEAPKPKKAAKSVYKRRAKKKAAAAPAPPKKEDILPLPSDSELTPPADDDSSFKADTVDP